LAGPFCPGLSASSRRIRTPCEPVSSCQWPSLLSWSCCRCAARPPIMCRHKINLHLQMGMNKNPPLLDLAIGRTCSPLATISFMLPESRVTPPLSPAEAARIALELYSLHADVRPLPGEYDDNFHLTTPEGRAFVLKIMHAARETSFVDMQCRAPRHLAGRAPHLALPRAIPNSSGQLFAHVQTADGAAASFGSSRSCLALHWPKCNLTRPNCWRVSAASLARWTRPWWIFLTRRQTAF